MKGEFEVTEEMVVALNRVYYGKDFLGDIETDVKYTGEAILAALAHEDFQRQLRAWAAGQMRGLVAKKTVPESYHSNERARARVWNACRAETITNIEKWESSNGQ